MKQKKIREIVERLFYEEGKSWSEITRELQKQYPTVPFETLREKAMTTKGEAKMSFSKEDIKFIKLQYRDAKHKDRQAKILSEIFDCKEKEIWDILGLEMPIKTKRVFKANYTEQKKVEIMAALRRGEAQSQLARKYNIAKSTICRWAAVVKKESGVVYWSKANLRRGQA